jgi:hypothetical protein
MARACLATLVNFDVILLQIPDSVGPQPPDFTPIFNFSICSQIGAQI